jgi:hypothetical protein
MKIYRVLTTGARNFGHIPSGPGAYLLYQNNKCYVGSSKNLRSRLRSHLRGPMAEWEMRFFLDARYRLREQKIIEALLAEEVELVNVNAVCEVLYGVPYVKPRNPESLLSRCRVAGVPYGTAYARLLAGGDPFVRPMKHLRMVTVRGKTKPMSQWCRETGISIELALARIKKGWPEAEAVSRPKIKQL